MIPQDVLDAQIEALKPENTYKNAVFFEQFSADGVKSHTSYGVTLLGHSLEGRKVLIHPLGIRDTHEQFSAVKELFEIYQKENFSILPKLLYVGNSPEYGYSIVFEAPEGLPLSDITEKGPLSYEKAFSIISNICVGLTPLHQAGLAHGNITSKNIYIDTNSQITLAEPFENHIHAYRRGKKVFDPFKCGVYRRVNFRYESPFKETNQLPTPSEDIYSLGGLLLEMLLGSKKLGKLVEAREDKVGSISEEFLLNPMKRAKSIPLAYSKWIASCIEQDKEGHFETLDACMAALRSAEVSRDLDPIYR